MKNQFNRYLHLAALTICALLLMRTVYSQNLSHLYLIWNIFLAYLPKYLSGKIAQTSKKSFHYLIFVLWILFLPNAPYLITDIIHLCSYTRIRQTTDTLLLFSSGIIGLFFYLISLGEMTQWMKKNYQFSKQELLIVIFSALSGYGLYLGRFLRLNSWEVFSNPDNVMHSLAYSFLNYQNLKESALISFAFAIFLYFAYKFFQPLLFRSHESVQKS